MSFSNSEWNKTINYFYWRGNFDFSLRLSWGSWSMSMTLTIKVRFQKKKKKKSSQREKKKKPRLGDETECKWSRRGEEKRKVDSSVSRSLSSLKTRRENLQLLWQAAVTETGERRQIRRPRIRRERERGKKLALMRIILTFQTQRRCGPKTNTWQTACQRVG